MQLNAEHTVIAPCVSVLNLVMSGMDDLLPYMPEVESVTHQSVETRDNGDVHIVSDWQGSSSTTPKLLRPFVSKEALAWVDDAVWRPSAHHVNWTIKSKMSKYYSCNGRNSFGPHPDDPQGKTLMKIEGDLLVRPENLPLVPNVLGRKMAPKIERFIIKLILQNFEAMSKALQRYFDDVKRNESPNPNSGI